MQQSKFQCWHTNKFHLTFCAGIEFDEFLAMYKRLFLQCRSVVSGEVDEIVSTGHKQKLAFSGALTKVRDN